MPKEARHEPDGNFQKPGVWQDVYKRQIYYNHSDYVGGMKETTLKEMLKMI